MRSHAEILCQIDELVQIEGNIAPGFELDFADTAVQSVECELFAAFAFETVIVVVVDLFFEDEGEFVGKSWQDLSLAG